MDDVADYAVTLNDLGKRKRCKEGTPRRKFSRWEWLKAKQLGVPQLYPLAIG